MLGLSQKFGPPTSFDGLFEEEDIEGESDRTVAAGEYEEEVESQSQSDGEVEQSEAVTAFNEEVTESITQLENNILKLRELVKKHGNGVVPETAAPPDTVHKVQFSDKGTRASMRLAKGFKPIEQLMQESKIAIQEEGPNTRRKSITETLAYVMRPVSQALGVLCNGAQVTAGRLRLYTCTWNMSGEIPNLGQVKKWMRSSEADSNMRSDLIVIAVQDCPTAWQKPASLIIQKSCKQAVDWGGLSDVEFDVNDEAEDGQNRLERAKRVIHTVSGVAKCAGHRVTMAASRTRKRMRSTGRKAKKAGAASQGLDHLDGLIQATHGDAYRKVASVKDGNCALFLLSSVDFINSIDDVRRSSRRAADSTVLMLKFRVCGQDICVIAPELRSNSINYLNHDLHDCLKAFHSPRAPGVPRTAPHFTFLVGHMNYPLQIVSPTEKSDISEEEQRAAHVEMIKAAVDKQSFEALFWFDTLQQQMAAENVISDFMEPLPMFGPTTGFRTGSTPHHTNYLADIPSYADRILFSCLPSDHSRLTQHAYSSTISCTTSKSKPVYAMFTIDVAHQEDEDESDKEGEEGPVVRKYNHSSGMCTVKPLGMVITINSLQAIQRDRQIAVTGVNDLIVKFSGPKVLAEKVTSVAAEFSGETHPQYTYEHIPSLHVDMRRESEIVIEVWHQKSSLLLGQTVWELGQSSHFETAVTLSLQRNGVSAGKIQISAELRT